MDFSLPINLFFKKFFNLLSDIEIILLIFSLEKNLCKGINPSYISCLFASVRDILPNEFILNTFIFRLNAIRVLIVSLLA